MTIHPNLLDLDSDNRGSLGCFDVDLEGVEISIYRFKDTYGYLRDPIVEVKSIKSGNFAFLSIGYEKDDMKLIKNQLVLTGDLIQFKYQRCRDIYIGITSFEQWVSEQVILTTSTNFEELIQSKIMVKTSDIKLIVNSGETTEAIKCHSNHLCIKSSYFFNLFESEFLESETGEIETHCSKEAIIPILQYIYTGEIEKSFFTKANYGKILEMYSKVCEYEMEKVKNIVEVFILALLDNHNFKLLVQSTILNRDDPFSMNAIKFIASYFK